MGIFLRVLMKILHCYNLISYTKTNLIFVQVIGKIFYYFKEPGITKLRESKKFPD